MTENLRNLHKGGHCGAYAMVIEGSLVVSIKEFINSLFFIIIIFITPYTTYRLESRQGQTYFGRIVLALEALKPKGGSSSQWKVTMTMHFQSITTVEPTNRNTVAWYLEEGSSFYLTTEWKKTFTRPKMQYYKFHKFT